MVLRDLNESKGCVNHVQSMQVWALTRRISEIDPELVLFFGRRSNFEELHDHFFSEVFLLEPQLPSSNYVQTTAVDGEVNFGTRRAEDLSRHSYEEIG